MTPERWKLIDRIVQSAIEREPSARRSFLDEACAGDPSLRDEVESLLEADEQAGDFIERVRPPAPLEDSEGDPLAGKLIGPYQIVRQIGCGGMGTVYLAARTDYRKRVAIKILNRNIQTKHIIKRFLAEREILAALDHPNIARLLDGGATLDGLPYLVMDFIEGERIDDYCTAHSLNTTERLRLFRSVCSAVHHAHQNLIIHRDLKPANILVTSDGAPKLLDFGIAKLLNPELTSRSLGPTPAMLRMMTPDYASPEQVRGETITAASDVYSLGVVLYELLTGRPPYRVKSRFPFDVAEAICEQEPEKPSVAVTRLTEPAASESGDRITSTPQTLCETREGDVDKLRRRLEGDLDNIVLKALRKDPAERYSSVEELSEDIRRHLDWRPVTARKNTLSYRSGKFIRRHQRAALTAALLVVALMLWWYVSR